MKFLIKICIICCCIFSGLAYGFKEFQVQSIKVNGLQKISKDAVLQNLPLRQGEYISSEDTSGIISSLFGTGFFKNISLAREGNTLIITVVERPSIGELKIVGIKNKDEVEKILKKYQIYEAWIYDPSKIAKAQEEIERHYLSKGYYGVRVDISTEELADNRILLQLDIYEGSEAKIKQIKIVGNKAFPEKTLLSQLHHAKTGIFSWYSKDDRYAKEKLAADLEIIQSYYMDRGYVNFQLESTQVSLTPNKKHVFITINVSEGDLYRFDEINLSGQLILPREELERVIAKHLVPGGVFSRKSIIEAKKAVEDLLADHGFGRADLRIIPEVDDYKKTVNLNLLLVPKQRLIVRRMIFEGNNLTKDEVLRRGFLQMEGSWITKSGVDEGKEYIQRAGFANKVEVEQIPVAGKEDTVDLKVNIEEQRSANVNAGIAWSKADRFSFNVGADFHNFLGSGKSLNFDFNHSKHTQSYSFGYFNPYHTIDGIGFGYNFYYIDRNLSKVSNFFDYGNKSYGVDVNWSFPLSLHDSLFLSFGVDNTILSFNESGPVPNEVRDFTRVEGRDFKELSASLGWRHNSLDRFILPTKGMTHRVVAKVSTPVSKLKYYRLEYDGVWFKPIVDGYIFQLSAQLGYQANYKKNQYFPFYKHFYAGGAETVRGFEERSLGPKDSFGNDFGGNIMLVSRTSLIFPPPFLESVESVRTAVFFDIGQVYDTNYKNRYVGNLKTSRNPTGLRYSSGVSLTWHIPLGVPLVFSYAWPLKKKTGDDVERFSFALSGSIF